MTRAAWESAPLAPEEAPRDLAGPGANDRQNIIINEYRNEADPATRAALTQEAAAPGTREQSRYLAHHPRVAVGPAGPRCSRHVPRCLQGHDRAAARRVRGTSGRPARHHPHRRHRPVSPRCAGRCRWPLGERGQGHRGRWALRWAGPPGGTWLPRLSSWVWMSMPTRASQPLGTTHESAGRTIDTDAANVANDPRSVRLRRRQHGFPEMALTRLAPLTSVGRTAARYLPNALGRLRPFLGDVASNAGYAAGRAAINEEDPTQAALAGAGGAAGARMLTRTLGGVAKPWLSNEARTLLDAGVTPTPGNLMSGPLGALARGAENLGQGLPGVGNVIDYSRNSAQRQALAAEIASRVPGQTTAQGANRAVSAAYNAVKPTASLDPVAAFHALGNAASTPIPMLTQQQGQQVSQFDWPDGHPGNQCGDGGRPAHLGRDLQASGRGPRVSGREVREKHRPQPPPDGRGVRVCPRCPAQRCRESLCRP